jgi:hypothetical protein
MYRLNPVLLFVLFLFPACKEEYNPRVTATQQSYLVVEGLINSGGATAIRLSLTTPLYGSAAVNPVFAAQVDVEGKDSRIYPLQEQRNGIYSSENPGLMVGAEYRLRIQLPDGRKYASDYVLARETPEIDSVSWERDEKGVALFVTTHDPSNTTRYYRWDYQETWEIHSRYFARYKYINGTVVPRDVVNDNIYYCWRDNPSASILVSSTQRLSEDVIFKKPLLEIPAGGEKLSVRYSILVKQYALDQKGYEFLQAMKKNTESLGSIFDAQPSEVRGNIHALSDPEEIVIGYITASSVTEKRIFIDAAQVPGWGYTYSCTSVEVANDPDSFKRYYPMLMPYDAHTQGLSIVGYYSSDPSCVDCTMRGVNRKPSFW